MHVEFPNAVRGIFKQIKAVMLPEMIMRKYF